MITGCILAIICALCLVAVIASYREIRQLEKLLAQIEEQRQALLIQREIDRTLMARYEIAIQSLPPEYRYRMIEKISKIKE